jgi:hypothetical protein
MGRYALILIGLVAFLGASCESSQYPEATAEDAVLAMEDVLLVSGTSMFLLFEAEDAESGELSNDSESVTLSWETVDRETGSGTYTITLTDHTIGSESIFAGDYNGYAMTGSIVLESQGPGSNEMRADLELGHDSPEEFPVRKLVMELAGSEEVEGRVVPTGSLRINGEEIDLALMAAAFE